MIMSNPYNSQLDAFTLYHRVQEDNRPSRSPIGPALPALGHAVSGSVGTAVSHLLLYPLDLVITRLQVQQRSSRPKDSSEKKLEPEEYRDIVDAFRRIHLEEGGVRALYQGVWQDTAKSVVDSFLFFLAYDFLGNSRKAQLQKTKTAGTHEPRLNVTDELVIGVLAGAFCKFLTTPIQNVVTRTQTAALNNNFSTPTHTTLFPSSESPKKTSRRQSPSTSDIIRGIHAEKGLPGFWSGYPASLILTLNPSLTFLFHSFLQQIFKRTGRNPSGALTFLVAALSKALASTITYPFSAAKTRAQASRSSSVTSIFEKSSASSNPITSVLDVAQREGVGAVYRGLGAEVVKGFLGHGVTMAVKERSHVMVVQFYYLVLRAIKRFPGPEEIARLGRERAGEMGDALTKGVDSGREKAGEVGKAIVDRVGVGREDVSEAVEGAGGKARSVMEDGVASIKGMVGWEEK
ncbi:mitochondrial carrier [Patellaria atrata CBS 101060]|uniref:Mitochondrial carrier n=1 Tax=Patellaria atrata CBS 101060 TaxID=1346257 RepID=A0A9P4S1A4_9PEZI|nr:mitochondrial carrier [Patellaria atrata CBS 101060]